MRGPSGAKAFVIAYLQANLDDYIAAFETAVGVTVTRPVTYKPEAPQALDNANTPLIAVTVERTSNIDLREVSDDGTDLIFDVTYACRVFVWAKTEGWDEVSALRDDLTTCVRIALLSRPSLTVAGDDAVVNPESMVEEYSEVAPVRGDRYLAGAFVAFDLGVTEVVSGGALGTVSTAAVDVLPPHPALD